MGNKQSTNPRALAVTLLERVANQGSYLNIALDQVLKQQSLAPRDAGLLTNIVYGTVQHQLTLDYWLTPFIKKPKKMEPWVRLLLQTALYQLKYLDRVPARAIFFETTEIAKKRGNRGVAGLVTAILRQIQRVGVADLTTIQPLSKQLSITDSVPEWLVAKLLKQLGETKTRSLLAAINQPPRASIRANQRLTTVPQLADNLKQQGIDVEASQLTPDALVATSGFLAGTAAFSAGEYTIQDESSMLVAPSLQVQPDAQVLDACAAPGGKTTHIATYLSADAGGQVVALDLHPNKVKLIRQNAKRLGVADVVQAQALDARQVATVFAEGQFDRILVDAPCSGLGLLRRKPEIRYARQPEDILNLAKVQLSILNSVASKVKPGGILTYSTCTIVDEENADVVAQFLAQHPEFTTIKVKTKQPLKVPTTPYLRLYPDDYGTDGFFICCLQRKMG